MSQKKLEYRQLIEPVLTLLGRSESYIHIDEISELVFEGLDFPSNELQQLLPSGRQTIFHNQLQWALSYLEPNRLIETDGADAYRITAIGRQYLSNGHGGPGPSDLPDNTPPQFFLSPGPRQMPGQATGMAEDAPEPGPTGPNQNIAREFEVLYQQLKTLVIKRIHEQSPAFFENLIIDLLLSMGYGDRRRDLVTHLGRTGDGGIDGAIKQDQLGLDVVYVQAKRYRPGLAVPVSAVRDFAGALEAHKANKGLFVTTSHFTKSGKEFITAISSRIVLIDGERLSSLLIRNNIGVRIHETYELKKIDQDYFNNT